MANTTSNYLNTSELFEGETKLPVGKLLAGKEVGRINDLGGSTGFTSTTDLQKKQAKSTDGGCGTSFTTATDPKNITVKHEVNGNFIEVATVNEQGDVQKKWITSAGTSMTFAEDGSIIFTTSKREGDPNSGRFDAVSQGSTRVKVGEALMIVVENKNKVIASKTAAAEGPAMSIVVYGNIDITSVSGEMNLKGKNINLNAENEINLNSGSKISLLAGKGKGENKKETTAGGTKESKVEYGGVVEIKTGDFKCDALTTRKTSSMDYNVIEAEGAVLSSKALANYGIKSPGSFTVDVSGDYHEKIGGLKRTEILATSLPVTTIFPGQKVGWLQQIGKVTGNAVSISATSGGFSFQTTKGDIDLSTKSGYWSLGSSTAGVVAGIDENKKVSNKNIKPGIYLKGIKQDIYIETTASNKIAMGLGTVSNGVVTNGITISQAKLEIKNTKGIYLN